MRLFSVLYDRAMRWSRHPHACWRLGGLRFAEPSFAPISVGSGARFFQIAALMGRGREPMERRLPQHVSAIGWVMLAWAGLVLLMQ